MRSYASFTNLIALILVYSVYWYTHYLLERINGGNSNLVKWRRRTEFKKIFFHGDRFSNSKHIKMRSRSRSRSRDGYSLSIFKLPVVFRCGIWRLKHFCGELCLFRSLMYSLPNVRARQEAFPTIVMLNMPFRNQHNYCFISTQTPTDSSGSNGRGRKSNWLNIGLF